VQPAFDALLGVVDEVIPVAEADVRRARDVLLGTPRLSARDALHIAIMQARGIGAVLSFDRGYDGYPGIERLG
jgi:predicted nucleic acid-binding protein